LLSARITAAFTPRPKIFSFCLLTILCFIAYANALPNSFHFDDIHGIVANPTVHNLKYLPAYFSDPSTFSMSMKQDWRPVLQISYLLNYLLGGLNPTLFRLFNLVVHVGTAFLIYLIVAEMTERFPPTLADESRWSSIATPLVPALLFAVHTANTEAVNYIWARSSMLVAFWYLLAFYCFLRGPFSGRTNGSNLWHGGGLACYALGLGTKATAITLPAILWLYELLFLNPAHQNPPKLFRAEPWRLNKYLPIMALFIAYLVLRAVLLPSTFMRVVAPEADPAYQSPGTYLFTAIRSWIYYLRLFLWPHPLIGDFHGFGWSYSFWEPSVLIALGVVILILGLARRVRNSEPLITFFAFWFFIALLPEASIVPLTEPIFVYRAYLAYAGLSVAVTLISLKAWAWVWDALKSRGRRGPARFWASYSLVVSLILGILTAATITRNIDWRTEMTLWSDVLGKDPTNPRAHMYLGLDYLDRENYKEAGRMFEKAVALAPKDAYAYMLRGYFNDRVDRNDRALADLNQAIQLDPRSHYNFFFRGELYRKLGEYEKALSDYEAAAELQPFSADAYSGIARVYWQRRELGQVTMTCKHMIDIDPGDPRGHHCLRMIESQQNR
jgi:tetratricopeptide (TPR) repeat protein